MSKLKSLPWKVAPKPDEIVEVGSADFGMLEIPRKNSLTINEAHFIREETKHYPDIQQQAIQLAHEISQEEGIDLAQAFESLSSGTTTLSLVVSKAAKKGQDFIPVAITKDIPQGSVILLDKIDLGVATKGSAIGGDRLFVEPLSETIPESSLLTVIIPSVIAKKHTVKLMEFQRESAEIAPLRNAVLATAMLRRVMGNDWTIDQTGNEVPAPVVNALAEFCSKEMNGWEDELETDEPAPVTEEVLKND